MEADLCRDQISSWCLKIAAQAAPSAPGSRRGQSSESLDPGDVRPWQPKVTASLRSGVGSNRRRRSSPQETNTIRPGVAASLLGKDEAQTWCDESTEEGIRAIREPVTLGGQQREKRWQGGSGGWWRNAGKALHVNRGDLIGARMSRAGVRALIVARKRGNACGAKGCRKVEGRGTGMSEARPVIVPETAKHQGEARDKEWEWVERSIWTEPMLKALETGVKGGTWYSLIDKVYNLKTLEAAWRKVRANKGSAGVDHQSIEAYGEDLVRNLDRLKQELQEGSYRPRAIRRVYIDKPGSRDKRPLGIPAVRDRVVQTALRMVMEPIFEREFKPMNFGFRPGLGCKDALREVEANLKQGYYYVVDADIRAYFDSIPHGRLLEEVGKRVMDGRILKLIEAYLKQDIVEDLATWTPEKGSPQGAVISPLLANLYLHPVDVNMVDAGYRMVRYADDFVIMCQSLAEAQAALEKVQGLLKERELMLHQEKTRVVDVRVPGVGFDFLGYHFEGGTRWPRKKSMKKFKEAIREKTGRSNGKSLEEIIKAVNVTSRGWFGYFKHSSRWTFSRLDGWIRRRIRSILRRRSKRQGISRGHDHNRWPNRFFHDNGLYSLAEAHRALLQSS